MMQKKLENWYNILIYSLKNHIASHITTFSWFTVKYRSANLTWSHHTMNICNVLDQSEVIITHSLCTVKTENVIF